MAKDRSKLKKAGQSLQVVSKAGAEAVLEPAASVRDSAGLSRRGFIAGAFGAGTAVALSSLAACSPTASSGPAEQNGAKAEGGSPDWLGAEPIITTVAETLECDVLVCGGGTGGLFAACAAAEDGAKVIVVEKSAFGGGIRDNIGSLNSRLQQEAGAVIDKEELLNDMYRYANGYCNPRLHRLWADISGEMVDWYQDRIEERGEKLFFEADNTHSATRFKHYPTGHIPSWPADAEFAGIPVELNGKNVLGDYLISKGGEARFETSLVKLLKTGDKVTGAIVEDAKGYIQINASKGVVVATGGYAWNQDMLNALQPHTQKLYSLCIAVPGTIGDGIKACLWAGASMDETHAGMIFDRVAVKPDEVGGHETMGKMMWIGSNPWLKVNLKGERFCNESAPYSYVAHAATSQPDQTWCTVWDSDWEKYVAQFDIHGCARVVPFDNDAPVNVPLEVERGMNEELIAQGHTRI